MWDIPTLCGHIPHRAWGCRIFAKILGLRWWGEHQTHCCCCLCDLCFLSSGTNAQIKSFAAGYGAEFQLFGKIDVNGPNESEVYSYLKSKFPGPVPWNFGAKFIVGKHGVPVKRYATGDNWGEIEQEVNKLL